jgi:nitroimidazol reductase NimA-like FMN-containing flavoprotein (pyridoxamine 5'-phosphate oxidase superfamily)
MHKYHLQNRPEREITSEKEIIDLIGNGKFITISLCRNNEPYIVTLSYGYDDTGKSLYFHAAKKGLKLDFLKANPLVCATIIEDGGYIEDECAHAYRSVVLWGRINIVEKVEEKKHGMKILLNHLESKPDEIKRLFLKADSSYEKMEVLRLDITEIHGKKGQ